MAAASKLNPFAAPFPCPYPYPYALPLHLAPPAPPPFPLADTCPPPFPFLTYCCVASPEGHRLGFCFPVQQPPFSSPRKGVLAAPPPKPKHGLPPHKLMAAFTGPRGAGKRQRQAPAPVPVKPVANAAVSVDAAPAPVPAPPRKPRMARLKAERWCQAKAAFSGSCGAGTPQAPATVPVKPVSATSVAVDAAPAQVPALPRKPRLKAERSQAKASSRPRKAVGPRVRLAVKREAPPPPLYTKRPVGWVKPKASELGDCTTIMLRNIPNKLRSGDMISLLDEQCARVNSAAGAVVAAYDVLYLPMDFRKEANFGYAFINFTTPAAAKALYCSLQNCAWKVHGSKKVIRIDQAAQQGRLMLVRHLERMRMECANDDFLPVEFFPPRDGVNVPAAPRRIRMLPLGRRGARAAASKGRAG